MNRSEPAVVDPSPESATERMNALRTDGYVIIPDALDAAELGAMRAAFDAIMDPAYAEEYARDPSVRTVIVKRLVERHPCFNALIDHHRVFPYLRDLIGRDITLAESGSGYFQPVGAQAFISWHNDFQWMVDVPYPRQNFWVRATWFLDDVTPQRSPIAVLPGSHRATGPCPTAAMTDAAGQPLPQPGQRLATGPAGACLINNTELWHCNTPNTSDRPRKLIMITYKHAWMRPWEEGYDPTPEFRARQDTPLRRQLCGDGIWHRCDGDWAV